MNDNEFEEGDEVSNMPGFSEELKTYYEGKYKDYEIEEEVDDEEKEDFDIHKTDSLILCTTAQEDIGNLEVYLYDEENVNLFVHHDIMLSAYPLAIEWLPLDWKNNSVRNYAIVGSFLPEIEIWNLDVLDPIDPTLVLGKIKNSHKYFKNLKKKAIQESNEIVHSDAVMSLNINPFKKFYG